MKNSHSPLFSKVASKHRVSGLVAAFCGYEVAAILSQGKIPTLTELNIRSKRVLGMVIVGGLAYHLFYDWPTERLLDDGTKTYDWRFRRKV